MNINIHKIALDAGALDACCFSINNPKLLEAIEKNATRHKKWLDKKYNGEMTYLNRGFEKKCKFQQTWQNYKSAIIITFDNDWGNVKAWHNFPTPQPNNPVGYISAYAKQEDYHITGHKILSLIAKKIIKNEKIAYKTCVDTAPIFERTLAVFGGLGEIAINDLLRTPNHGVRIFIGVLFIDKLLPDLIHQPKMPFPCHHCNNCLNNCPTGALTKEGIFLAKKCSSYLSIETKGVLNKQQQNDMGNWLFGCDDCSIVCPPKDKIDTRIPVDLQWLLQTSSGRIKKIIKGTAIEYANITKLRRNAVIILKRQNSSKAKEILLWVKNNNKSPLIQKQLTIDD